MADFTKDNALLEKDLYLNQSMTDALLDSIRGVSGEDSLSWARPPVRLTGGFFAEMWRIRLKTDNALLAGDLVARVMPDPEVAHWETEVQDHLAKHGFPTPAVRLSAPPGPHLDRAWILMDLAPGEPLLKDFSVAETLANLLQFPRSIPDALARDTAALHSIDPEPLIAKLGTQDVLAELHDQVTEVGQTDLIAAVDQLAQNRPQDGTIVICHGDLHPFNVLTHSVGDTIIDWSTSRLTVPEYDLAYTSIIFLCFPTPVPQIMAPVMEPVIDRVGKTVAERFVGSYEQAVPWSVDRERLSWCTKLHALKILNLVASWYVSGGSGPEDVNHPFLVMAPKLQRYLGLDFPYDL